MKNDKSSLEVKILRCIHQKDNKIVFDESQIQMSKKIINNKMKESKH